jgi:hypothetical protein
MLPTTKPAPDLSVKDVAFREAFNAYAVGLSVSAVLTAHAACEIWLAERLVSHLMMRGMADRFARGNATAEETLAAWDAADKEVLKIPSIEKLLDRLNEVGAWVRTSLGKELRVLAGNRQHLSHYRAYHRQKTRRLEVGPDGKNFKGSFLPSIHVDPEKLEKYAEQALMTMVDLWVMPVSSFNPKSPPPPDWEPPTRPN